MNGLTFSHNAAVLEPGDRVSFFPRDTGRTQYLAYGADNNFYDIRTSGAVSTARGSTASQVVPLGFTFDYYGRSVETISITTNGQLNLDGSASYINYSVPSIVAPRGLIGPLWDDLYNPSSATQRILYATVGRAGARSFIVQWQRVPFASYTTDTELTFQVRLNEADNSIEYVYGPLIPGNIDAIRRGRASGSSTTVGLQNYERNRGLTIGYNDPGVTYSGSWFVMRPNE